MLRRVVTDGVFVAAEDVDGVAADAQARAGNQALVDGVADGGIGGACAFGAHVALGGEAGHQVVAGGERGEDGALGDGFLDSLQVFRAGVKEKMDVSVDQAGEQGAVAEVDNIGSGGMLDRGSDLEDAVALNQNFGGRDDLAGLHAEQTGGVENDGGLISRGSLGGDV